MANKKGDPFQRARNYAFLLLKFRLRSEKELYARLKKKKIEEEVIRATLSFLKAKGFIDDHLFAKTWLESRLKKPLGLLRLRQELKIKGIDKEIIDAQLAEIKKNYSEEDIVFSLAKSKFNKLKGIEPQKAKQRLYGYLARRGFSPEVVMDAIRHL